MRIAMFFIGVTGIVFLDQLTKYFAPKFFTVSYNSGIAWSILIPNELIIAFTVIFFIVAGFLLFFHSPFPIHHFPFTLLFGGALGNFIDRLAFGAVRDFIRVGSFPAFNLADSAITASVFCLIFFYDKLTKRL